MIIMKNYIGTKQIKATPMDRLAYNEYRGWKLPEDENGADEGYLVEYVDGGKPNHPEHEGYISWSPKEQFEKAYKIAESFVDRLLIEKFELDSKIKKLMEGLTSKKVPDSEVGILSEQLEVMETYAQILDYRLKLVFK